MQEPHDEGVANHIGLESCAGAREGVGEALTEGRVGWVWSRETLRDRDADAMDVAEGTICCTASARGSRARAVGDLRHAGTHLAREPGDPATDLLRWRWVRAMNPKGVRWR